MLETLTKARALVVALEAAQEALEALTSLGSVSTAAPTEAEAAPTEPPVGSPVAFTYSERLRSLYVNPVGEIPDGMEIDPDDPPEGLRWGVFVELTRTSRKGTACYSAYGTPSGGFDSLAEAVAAWRAWATVAGLLDNDGAARDGWELTGDQFSVDRVTIEKGELA